MDDGQNSLEYRNAQALAKDLDRVKTEYNARIQHLENKVATLENLVNGMMQTVQVALHEVRGSRSTEGDRGDLG